MLPLFLINTELLISSSAACVWVCGFCYCGWVWHWSPGSPSSGQLSSRGKQRTIWAHLQISTDKYSPRWSYYCRYL